MGNWFFVSDQVPLSTYILTIISIDLLTQKWKLILNYSKENLIMKTLEVLSI